MKTILTILTITISYSASADGFNNSKPEAYKLLPGTYSSYSNTCGFEIEISGKQVIMTGIDNSFLNVNCRDKGQIVILDCDNEMKTCYRNNDIEQSGCANYHIQVLEDGNFLGINPCNQRFSLVKFVKN